MYSPVYISNNFLARSFGQKTPVTAMKIQKMLYFLYRDHLKKTGKALFSERFSTWKYGPVIESVYHTYKTFGANSITQYGGNPSYSLREDDYPLLKELINHIWEKSRPYNGIYLSQLTHKPECAWYAAWINNSPFLLDEDIVKDTVEII
jgi:uncharacterized phage-associated protein